jgi:hypothetical protein
MTDRAVTTGEIANKTETRELSLSDLENVSGGKYYRITNIRVNANGITGGGPIPANAVAG